VVDKNLSLLGNRVGFQNQRKKNGGISYLDTAVHINFAILCNCLGLGPMKNKLTVALI